MRFSLVLALMLAVLTATAGAQKHQKPKAKPSYTEEKPKKSAGPGVKAAPNSHASTSQELRRVEQSGAKASASRKATSSKPTRLSPALKGEKKDANPPIHFAAAGNNHGSKSSKGADPYKGRLRHKGSRH